MLSTIIVQHVTQSETNRRQIFVKPIVQTALPILGLSILTNRGCLITQTGARSTRLIKGSVNKR